MYLISTTGGFALPPSSDALALFAANKKMVRAVNVRFLNDLLKLIVREFLIIINFMVKKIEKRFYWKAIEIWVKQLRGKRSEEDQWLLLVNC
jgi:DUF1365 family protein